MKLRRQWRNKDDSLIRTWRLAILVTCRLVQIAFKQTSRALRHFFSEIAHGFLIAFIRNSFNDNLGLKHENFYASLNTRHKDVASAVFFRKDECSHQCIKLWNRK